MSFCSAPTALRIVNSRRREATDSESTRPVVAGLVAGMCLAEGASYLLRGVLYGLPRVDSISFAGVSLVFLAIALLASYVPSRKAMRVDPIVALRYE